MSPIFKKILIILGIVLSIGFLYMLYFDGTFLASFPYKYQNITKLKQDISSKENNIKTLKANNKRLKEDIKSKQTMLDDTTTKNSSMEQSISNLNMSKDIEYESILIFAEQRALINHVMITDLNLNKTPTEGQANAQTNGQNTSTTTTVQTTPANGNTTQNSSQNNKTTTNETATQNSNQNNKTTSNTPAGTTTPTAPNNNTANKTGQNGTQTQPGNTVNAQQNNNQSVATPNPGEQNGLKNQTIKMQVVGDYFNIEKFIEDLNSSVGKYNYITKVNLKRGETTVGEWFMSSSSKINDKNIVADIELEFNYKQQ